MLKLVKAFMGPEDRGPDVGAVGRITQRPLIIK